MITLILAALAVDFSTDAGAIRHELHSSGYGPTICGQSAQDLADMKAMGFKYSRTHDWALINSFERVCDYFHIFPLMHLDAKDPKSYYFPATDYILKRTREELGTEIFYRLGSSIEHSGEKVHFNTVIPDDFEKVAESFAATVRHYNRGWADGHKWGIKYWEIWNEPDGIENMWCPPEGTYGLSPEALAAKRLECRAKFVDFFVVVLKRLKGEFGDSIKVGGPGLVYCNDEWTKAILEGCRAAGVKPDFISWHDYICVPDQMNIEAERTRAICDSYGFPDCKTIVTEWHYFGEHYTWGELRSSDPKTRTRVMDGPDGHIGIRSACFTLSALASLQKSQLTHAFFYGGRHTGSWGFKDGVGRKYKLFYALKLFGDIVREYDTICSNETDGTLTAMAVRNGRGGKALLVSDYGGAKREIKVAVSGVPADAKVSCLLLDNTHDLEPFGASFKDGVLTLLKPDFHSAAFFVEFVK